MFGAATLLSKSRLSCVRDGGFAIRTVPLTNNACMESVVNNSTPFRLHILRRTQISRLVHLEVHKPGTEFHTACVHLLEVWSPVHFLGCLRLPQFDMKAVFLFNVSRVAIRSGFS